MERVDCVACAGSWQRCQEACVVSSNPPPPQATCLHTVVERFLTSYQLFLAKRSSEKMCLSNVSKVVKKVIHGKLSRHCLDNRIIPDEQFGFLRGRSAKLQLLSTWKCGISLWTNETMFIAYCWVRPKFSTLLTTLLCSRCLSPLVLIMSPFGGSFLTSLDGVSEPK